MSINYFLSKENISTLWDVITDEDIFKFLSKNIQNKILQIFTENLKGFFDSEKNKTKDLMDLNKIYIVFILNYIKQIYPQQPNKIKIHDNVIPNTHKELITFEDIQNDRKSQFEINLNKRQEEFINAITLPVPPVPEFKDNIIEEPIIEMDKMIKEIMKQRNYEMEYLHNNSIKTPTTDEWLQSEETSIKTEKLKHIDKNNNNNNNDVNNKKNVSWGLNDTREFEENDKIIEENIFNKLKKISNNESNSNIDNRMIHIENEIKMLNNKLDRILTYIIKN